MQISFRPGEFYAYPTPGEEGVLKVGKALITHTRMKSHQTSHSKRLTAGITQTFLDCFWVETQVKRRLADVGCAVDGEHYRTTLEHVQGILEELRVIEEPIAQALQSGFAYLQAADYFHGNTTRPNGLCAALELLLDGDVRRANTKVKVGALIQGGLAASDVQDSLKRLASVGLVLVPGCSCAVLDKTARGKLEHFFASTPAARSWRKQLANIAAVDSSLEPIDRLTFQNSAMASFHLKDISCRE